MTVLVLFAALCVGLMGFAIQRGSTCTVAAVDECLSKGSAHKLSAMLEASLWVAGGLALARLASLAGSMPPAYAADAFTVLGGVLLGLGAWLNRACVFGTVARLGGGDWAYAATPLGFFIGCWAALHLWARPVPPLLAPDSPLLAHAALVAPLFVIYLLWRLWALLRQTRVAGRQAAWSPHTATLAIGATFVLSWLLAGRWAYTDVLADLALRMSGTPSQLGLSVLLLLALFGGALLAGALSRGWRPVAPSLPLLLRCLSGGVLMGWGSLLIPGSNDGLILMGMPLLRPHAWLAFASMCCTIAAALWLQSAWARRAAAQGQQAQH